MEPVDRVDEEQRAQAQQDYMDAVRSNMVRQITSKNSLLAELEGTKARRTQYTPPPEQIKGQPLMDVLGQTEEDDRWTFEGF